MGGPNLEVFKFSVYVFFPVVMLFYYGNPDWYAKNVLPVRFALLRSCRIRCLDILLCSTRTGSSLLNTESSRCAYLAQQIRECAAAERKCCLNTGHSHGLDDAERGAGQDQGAEHGAQGAARSGGEGGTSCSAGRGGAEVSGSELVALG